MSGGGRSATVPEIAVVVVSHAYEALYAELSTSGGSASGRAGRR